MPTGLVTYTADEVARLGQLLRIEFDVRYTVTSDAGDSVTPGTGCEISALSFWPTEVTDARGSWPKSLVENRRAELRVALDRWYAAEPRYALDDLMFDAATSAADLDAGEDRPWQL